MDMEMDHSNVEQQVWQRVMQQPPQQPGEDLRELMRTSGELAALYRQLSTSLTGKPRELAGRLYEAETAALGTLKGLGRLMGREGETLKLWQPGKAPAAKQLEKAYHRTRRSAVDCMARSAQPEFGTVFRRLADQAEHRCTLIAQLLGIIG